MKRKILRAITFVTVISACAFGCASADKTAFQAISAVNTAEQMAWGEYVAYRSAVKVAPTTDANVVKAFNTLQQAELLAVDATTNGATLNTATISSDLSDIVNLLNAVGVKVGNVQTNF